MSRVFCLTLIDWRQYLRRGCRLFHSTRGSFLETDAPPLYTSRPRAANRSLRLTASRVHANPPPSMYGLLPWYRYGIPTVIIIATAITVWRRVTKKETRTVIARAFRLQNRILRMRVARYRGLVYAIKINYNLVINRGTLSSANTRQRTRAWFLT